MHHLLETLLNSFLPRTGLPGPCEGQQGEEVGSQKERRPDQLQEAAESTTLVAFRVHKGQRATVSGAYTLRVPRLVFQ